ncbi:glycosyl transferase [Pokkaliibacter plantistimulans]|uniref:Glycosyl transferase n=1 Tax=Proteobacteria bacterium 228 TaxID=2083153 RepID=A0A2S5KUK3_9PROT|nr:glycosyltransferase [Pokkaliibacter plantistimulans]PPC78440.1 glycosyl transferase [Pokkaliibacter plantistimulans]
MKVSVLVPVYNLERFVLPCLESLLAQETDFDFEVIAVDDCSPDNSYALMLELASREPRLKVYHNEQNQGLAKTQKRLLSLASGEYLAYLDGDDLALPGKLQSQADYLDQHQSCGIVYHEAEVFDSDTDVVTGHYSRDYYNSALIPPCAGVEHLIRYGCFPNASSIMFRCHDHLTDAIDEDCRIILDHPWHILNLLYIGGTIDFIPDVLGRYRIHSQSFGGQTKRSPERREQVLKDQLKACENARAFGVAEEVIAQGKSHYEFATALYFLNAGDNHRFNCFIEESAKTGWFFNKRHHYAYEHRDDPDDVRLFLKAVRQ